MNWDWESIRDDLSLDNIVFLKEHPDLLEEFLLNVR
jgi:hypothetical protein